MRYSDLVQFEPIETVIQLRDADEVKAARQLVKDYKISNRMADQLVNLVIPQLQFQKPLDNKGVLIVGNYGTGKSHLMSMISAVAEHADLLDEVSNPNVKKASKVIAGKFKVLRVEIGSVTSNLRDILLGELEDALKKWKTPYKFPSADKIANNKNAIIEAMAEF
jgi:DNA replication protein DnaC